MGRFAATSFTILLVLAGCDATNTTGTKIQRDDDTAKSPTPAVEPFDIDDHLGQPIVVEGTLEGNWLVSPSGGEFGVTHKGRDPLRIRYHSVPLALSGAEKVAQQLVDSAGKQVRLQGHISRITVEGRRRHPLGQAGYTGEIPAHVVYYMFVTSCETFSSGPVSAESR